MNYVVLLQKSQTMHLYAKSMTTCDIQDKLKEMYHVDISHKLIPRVTESIQEEIIEWKTER